MHKAVGTHGGQRPTVLGFAIAQMDTTGHVQEGSGRAAMDQDKAAVLKPRPSRGVAIQQLNVPQEQRARGDPKETMFGWSRRPLNQGQLCRTVRVTGNAQRVAAGDFHLSGESTGGPRGYLVGSSRRWVGRAPCGGGGMAQEKETPKDGHDL